MTVGRKALYLRRQCSTCRIPGSSHSAACYTNRQPEGRSFRRQSRGLRIQAKEIALRSDGRHCATVNKELPSRLRALAPEGIDHIVEVAFGANVEANVEL
jgi:hypothetical protein